MGIELLRWNIWTISLIIIFLLAVVGGYFLMSSEVRLIKKEIWNWLDVLKSLSFGLIFGMGVLIIFATIATFIMNGLNLEYKDRISHANLLLIPMLLCLIVTTLYPLYEFLIMARNPQPISVTPIQALFERIIRKFNKPYSYLIALGLYIGVLVLPLLLITFVLGADFIIAWISWMLFYPMAIIVYYSTIGYIIGFAYMYSNIPALDRSTFLHFDKSNRAQKAFFRNPLPYVALIIMTYIYVFEFFKTIDTLRQFSINSPSSTQIYNKNVDWTIPISILFAIIAYFVRYWKKKIKISLQSILFSGFLIAAVGVNVLTNYLISRPGVFAEVMETWDLTKVLFESRGDPLLNVQKFTELNLIGAIEETGLFILISYFFFFEPKRKLFNDTLLSTLASAGENFDPIPPFNMVRYENQQKRNTARTILLKMYDRVPKKRGYELTQDVFKESLFDAISDLHNPYAREIAYEILQQLMLNSPKESIPVLTQELKSRNFDKIRPILSLLESHGQKVIPLLDLSVIYPFLLYPDYSIQRVSTKIVHQYYKLQFMNPDQKLSKDQMNLHLEQLNHADYEIQAEALEILKDFGVNLSKDLFSQYMEHPIEKLREIATKAVSTFCEDQIDETSVPKLIELLDHANPKLRAVAFESLAKIGKFDENQIPISKYITAISDENDQVRNSAIQGIRLYLQEKPLGIQLDSILKLMNTSSIDVQISLLDLVELTWKQIPATAIPRIITLLTHSDFNLRKKAQTIILEIASQDTKLVVNKLFLEHESEIIIRRGKIVETIDKIAEDNWKKVIPLAFEALVAPEEFIRINAASVLNDISEKHPEDINLNKIHGFWVQESSYNVKKELISVSVNLIKRNPEQSKPFLDAIFTSFQKMQGAEKNIIAKMMVNIATTHGDLIEKEIIKFLVEDKDPPIREAGIKLIGYSTSELSKEMFNFLLKGLADQEFGVKNAAIESIAHLTESSLSTEITETIKSLLYDKNKWTRQKASDVCLQLVEKNPEFISLDELNRLFSSPDQDEIFRVNIEKMIGMVGFLNLSKSFQILLQAMQDINTKVRDGAIQSMIRLASKVDLREIIPKLLYYMSDETSLVLQQSIARALMKIIKYETGDLKARVISVLSIRASTTQDPIIAAALAEIKN